MKRVLIVAAALTFTAPAQAEAPTPAQKADFLATCLKVAPVAGELCRCKADAAMTLIKFMAIVIGSMKGKDVPDASYDAYADYIARSTQACGMGSSM